MGWTSLRRVESKGATLAATDAGSPGRYRIIASVTNVLDDDGDIIIPGAYRETLRKRRPKVLHAHDWAKPIGKVLDIEEYMPGDSRLPTHTPQGDPWPEGAGALIADIELFLGTKDGKDADERIRQYGVDAQWSIGYRVKKANRTKEARLLRLLDLFEVSEVLWGANDLTGPMPEGLALKMLAGVMEEKEFPVITDQDSLDEAVKMYRESPTRELRDHIMAKAEELDLDVPEMVMPDEETEPEPDEESEPAGDDESEEESADEVDDELEKADIPDMDNPNPDDEEAVTEIHTSGGAMENWDEVRTALRYCESQYDLDDEEAEEKRAYSSEQRDQMAGSGVAMPDGSYPIRDRADLLNAIQAVGRAKDYNRAKRHIIKRARALDLVNLLPDEWDAGKKLDIEAKGGVPGVADTPEDIQSVRRLRRWYVRGEGAARIMWGTPGSFRRCVAIAGKHMSPENAKGYCALRYKEATGRWPGRQRGDKKEMSFSDFNAALAMTLMEGKMSNVSSEAVVEAAKRLLETLVEEGVVVRGVTDGQVEEADVEADDDANGTPVDDVDGQAEADEATPEEAEVDDTSDAGVESESVVDDPAEGGADLRDDGDGGDAPASEDADEAEPVDESPVTDEPVAEQATPEPEAPAEPEGVEIDLAEVEALLAEVDPAAL